jgi:hypothetical protein
MSQSDLYREAAAFFDDFVSAFAKFDGDLIAVRYVAPYLTMRADGSAGLFPEHSGIGVYFQGVVDSYQRRGCRACRYASLDVVPLGERCLLATVTWELLSQDGSIVSMWRESYNLLRGADGLRVFASVDHAT